MEGVSYSTMMNKNIRHNLKVITQITNNNYPEIMKKLYIINAPSSFKFLWSIIKKFIDKNTVKKIEVLGHDYQ